MKPSACSASANLGPTPLSAQRSSCGALPPSSLRCTGARENVAGDVAGRRGGFAGDPAPFARPLLLAMCGRTGALSVSCTRCLGRSRMNASTSATTMTITHQYSRIRSIRLTNSIVRCSAVEARPDRRAAARKGSPARATPRPSTNSGRPPPLGRPAGARDTRQLVQQADELAALEVVGRARKSTRRVSGPRCRCAVTWSHFVIDERSPRVALDLRLRTGRRRRAGRTTGAASDQRRDEADRASAADRSVSACASPKADESRR